MVILILIYFHPCCRQVVAFFALGSFIPISLILTIYNVNLLGGVPVCLSKAASGTNFLAQKTNFVARKTQGFECVTCIVFLTGIIF